MVLYAISFRGLPYIWALRSGVSIGQKKPGKICDQIRPVQIIVYEAQIAHEIPEPDGSPPHEVKSWQGARIHPGRVATVCCGTAGALRCDV